jgi:hypothetical protein
LYLVSEEKEHYLYQRGPEYYYWWGANVDVIPVMNFDELMRGLQNR